MLTRDEAFKKLREKVEKFDDMNKFDFSDLGKFMKIYLNTEDESKREQLAEKFKKRYLEAYELLKSSPELIEAEREISKAISGDFGDISAKNGLSVTNFFEIIKESFDNK